ERVSERRAVLLSERAVGDQDQQGAGTERRRLTTEERTGVPQRARQVGAVLQASRDHLCLEGADGFLRGGAAHGEEAPGAASEEERVEPRAGRQCLDDR